jgi:hypothetical protein
MPPVRTDADKIARVVFEHQQSVGDCADSTMAGDVDFRYRVEGGKLVCAQLLRSTMKDPTVAPCVIKWVRKLRFPALDRGYTLEHRMTFDTEESYAAAEKRHDLRRNGAGPTENVCVDDPS